MDPRALLDVVGDAVYVVDASGHVEYANPVAVATLGYDAADELLGRPSHATIHYKRPDGSPFPHEECPLLHPPVSVDEDWFVRRDGTMVPVAYTSTPLEGGAVVVFRDRTDAERERAARIVAAADRERRRLSRDLHDGAQQRLVTAAMLLDTGGDLAVAREELRVALEDLRRLARGLHPSVLEHRGLHAAIASLTASSPIPVTVDVPDVRFDESVEAAVYFLVAEAVTNALKHAGASAISVRVREGVEVEVADDGRGGAVITVGGGLAGLEDRIAALGGALWVESDASGTVLRARLTPPSA